MNHWLNYRWSFKLILGALDKINNNHNNNIQIKRIHDVYMFGCNCLTPYRNCLRPPHSGCAQQELTPQRTLQQPSGNCMAYPFFFSFIFTCFKKKKKKKKGALQQPTPPLLLLLNLKCGPSSSLKNFTNTFLALCRALKVSKCIDLFCHVTALFRFNRLLLHFP